MGRHSLPDDRAAAGGGDRPPRRRRNVAIATVLVLAVAGGAAVAVRGGPLPFSTSCEENAVHLSTAASPDIAPAVRAIADRARTAEVRSDGRRVDVNVVARDAYKVVGADREEPNEIAVVTGGGGYQVNDPAEIQAVILQAVMTAGQGARAAGE